jgi:HEAT repeat protein
MDGIVPPGEVVKVDHTVAFDAYREAELLHDPDLVPQLIAFLDAEPDKRRRMHATFILFKLGLNVKTDDVVRALIARVAVEPDWRLRSHTLDDLGQLRHPLDADVEPILAALKDKQGQVRCSAMKALAGSSSPKAEPALIDVLKRSKDPYEIVYSNMSLGAIGTPSAIPSLERHAASRKRDVKSTAASAIRLIRRRHGLPETSEPVPRPRRA